MFSVGADSTVPSLGTVRLSMTLRVVESLTVVMSTISAALEEEEEAIYARTVAPPLTAVYAFIMETSTSYVPTIVGSRVAEY